MNLEQFLNIAIPVGFFVFLFGIIYVKSKEPIDRFFGWVWDGIRNLFGAAKHAGATTKEVVYDQF